MLTKITNVAVVVVFCIWAAAFGFEILIASQDIPTEQQRYGTSTINSDANAIAALNQPHTDEKTAKRKADQRQAAEAVKKFFIGFLEIKLTDLLIAVFTIVLAVKTAGLFRETAGLREAAEKQRTDSLRSIAAAEIAAAAAFKSAETAEKSLLAANQPLLIIEELILVGPDDLNAPSIKFTIANDGNGTAVVLSIGGHIQTVEVAGALSQYLCAKFGITPSEQAYPRGVNLDRW